MYSNVTLIHYQVLLGKFYFNILFTSIYAASDNLFAKSGNSYGKSVNSLATSYAISDVYNGTSDNSHATNNFLCNNKQLM